MNERKNENKYRETKSGIGVDSLPDSSDTTTICLFLVMLKRIE